MQHLRLPSVDRGTSAFLWGLFFGLFVWLGGVAVGVGSAMGVVLGLLVGAASYFFIRLRGE
jgi:hypothetical protein